MLSRWYCFCSSCCRDSVFAGVSFFLQSSAEDATLSKVAGSALLGGIFFLASALGRTPSSNGRDPCRARSGSGGHGGPFAWTN
jgi:hypothetical protein